MNLKNMLKIFGITASIITAAIQIWPAVEIGAEPKQDFRVAAQEVFPSDGVFKFEVMDFKDGRARHFIYKASPDINIRFFIVESVENGVKAAFDACQACFRAKKGYVQQGKDMVCINCGLKFRIERINEARGGCNPIPLQFSVQSNYAVIAEKDILQGTRFFQ